MKRIALLVVCIAAIGQAFGQPVLPGYAHKDENWRYHRELLINGRQEKIELTSELAKELLLYSFVSITDSGLIGESNWMADWYGDGGGSWYSSYGFCDWVERYSSEHHNYYYFELADNPIENGKDVFCSDFINGFAIIAKGDDECGGCINRMVQGDVQCEFSLVNKQGKISIPFKKYDKLAHGVYEGLVTVCKDKKWGFATSDGTVKINLQYEDARRFSEGLAAVKKDGRWGYIDKYGKVVIPFKYSYAGDFKKGVAVVISESINCLSNRANIQIATGLINHSGSTTFDLLGKNGLIKEYGGPYTDEKTNLTGKVKYTYYEDENGARVKHGYYIFYSDYYQVDGHYKDGKKFGQWIEEWGNTEEIGVLPFFHRHIGRSFVSTKYNEDITRGYYGYNFDDSRYHGAVDGPFVKSVPYDFFIYDDKYIHLDETGALSDIIVYRNEGYSGDIIMEVTLTFYKGVPMKVEEYDESTGKRNVLFQYEGFTTVDDIKEVASNDVRLYKIGDFYYELEPKDPLYPFDLFDVNKYSKELARDMSFILNLPASWPIEEIKSPQLNYFKKASREKVKSFEYSKYSKIFDSYSEYSKAYDLGEDLFKQRVDEKQREKRDVAYNKNKHLFLGEKEFVSYYSQGEDVFNDIVNNRNNLYNDFEKKETWFVDFSDYLKCTQRGSVDEEINVRREVYTDDKNYFTGPKEFIKFYVQGEVALSAEINKRQEEYNKCKMPDGGGNLFKDMSEFLTFYLQGDYTKEYAVRRFKYRLNDFASLNLKDAKDSKKEDVKQFLVYLAECKAISNDAYPPMIEMLVNKNSKMIKEWDENGEFFVNEVEFYEAYITDDYKTILKNKKNK